MPNTKHITHTVTIPVEQDNKRLDQVIAHLLPDYSRSQIQAFIKSGGIKIDGETLKRPRDKAKANSMVVIDTTIVIEDKWAPEAIDLSIVFEDEHLLVINKPAGLVVHPGAGNPNGTLLNALLNHHSALNELPRAGIVHRIDKDTTGLLVVAKTSQSYQYLVDALQERNIHRNYQAIVKGVMTGGRTIDAPIGRHPKNRTQMAVTPNGKPATTHCRVISRFPSHTYISLKLESGRTHQIRVHMAHIGYPLLGDPAYGKHMNPAGHLSEQTRLAIYSFKRQALHASSLELAHPKTETLMGWQAPLPDDMQHLVDLLNTENE